MMFSLVRAPNEGRGNDNIIENDIYQVNDHCQDHN